MFGTKQFSKGLVEKKKKISGCLLKLRRNKVPTCKKLFVPKHTTQGVFYMLVPQLLKFWKIRFETVKPHFLK
jgi:hypothetical protein